mmetsp:Transcript_13524/g.32305  ORF Transcript_13524/g.32305 Transcript_13524/m.32305 type:complete len:208 (-) Transcript_13524:3-626(-)
MSPAHSETRCGCSPSCCLWTLECSHPRLPRSPHPRCMPRHRILQPPQRRLRLARASRILLDLGKITATARPKHWPLSGQSEPLRRCRCRPAPLTLPCAQAQWEAKKMVMTAHPPPPPPLEPPPRRWSRPLVSKGPPKLRASPPLAAPSATAIGARQVFGPSPAVHWLLLATLASPEPHGEPRDVPRGRWIEALVARRPTFAGQRCPC